MAHIRAIAFLLGLEGVSLLRAGADPEFDGRFIDDRLDEVRRLLADEQELRLSAGLDVGAIDTRAGYEQWSQTYDGESNPLLTVEEPIVRQLLDQLPLGTVLDAACGTGRHSRTLVALGHRVVGVDSSPHMLERARVNVPELVLVEGDVSSLPLADDSVDVAVCCLALTHVPSLDVALQQLARVVRPGGCIITSDIHVASLYLGGVASVASADGSIRAMPAARYLASDYIQAARRAGLSVDACIEPRWGPVDGEGGPLAQALCPAAAAAAYRQTPGAIVWKFVRP